MPELKNIRVREAKISDRGLFKKLWKALLEEENKNGAVILPTEANVEVAANLFDNYVDGTYDGLVLFVADKAVVMFGDPVLSFETSLGKIAYGWGIYVSPEVREMNIANELLKVAVDKLRARGFNNVYCEVREENEGKSLKALEHFLPIKKHSSIFSASFNGEK